MIRALGAVGGILAVLLAGAASPARAGGDWGPIAHGGLKKRGRASTGLKLPLEIGLTADVSGMQKKVKKASSPSSSSYGKYPSLSTLASNYGASKNTRQAVKQA